MATIFISYRRDDSEGFAGRIRDRLVEHLGESAVFQDLESIPPGEDVRNVIDDAVKQCRVMLVLIDKQWLNIENDSGQRRLDREDDFVRLEISAGLKYGLKVFPILLRGTPMPHAWELPEPLQPLANRNALFVHSNSFNLDVKRLIDVVTPLVVGGTPRRRGSLVLVGVVALAVVFATLLLWILTRNTVGEQFATTPDPQAKSTESAEPTELAVPATLETVLLVASNREWTAESRVVDGVEMVKVPAGCFLMGSESGAADEKPTARKCFLIPYWIDMFEVTNIEFGSPGTLAGDQRPRDSVNWQQAVDHCARRGGRLPTEVEWEYAARGPDGINYPWGNAFVDDFSVFNAPEFALVGSKSKGISWVGAHDMAGNLWEWTSTWFAPYEYDSADGREALDNPNDYQYRVLRGGSWGSEDSFYLRSAYRYGYEPGSTNHFIGFRCVQSD